METTGLQRAMRKFSNNVTKCTKDVGAQVTRCTRLMTDDHEKLGEKFENMIDRTQLDVAKKQRIEPSNSEIEVLHVGGGPAKKGGSRPEESNTRGSTTRHPPIHRGS